MRMSFFSDRLFKLILGGLVFLFVLITIKDVYTQPPPPTYPYTLSAHGNTGYGVKRSATGFPTDYSRGNCAHCHEQHASIGGAEPAPNTGTAAGPDNYLLLSDFLGQFDVPCFDCHTETSQLQDPQGPMNLQYNYSRIAGGDTTITCPDNIARAFAFVLSTCAGSRAGNCSSSTGSAHCLSEISTFLKSKSSWGFDSSVAANNDPCSGCHNPHRAQRDFSSPPQSFVWTSGVSSLSRPSTHSKDNNVWQLWGDDTSERMSNLGVTYQPPYRSGGVAYGYEPDGGASDASRTVDFVTFCQDCHLSNMTASPYSLSHTPINWTASGDIHGTATEACTCVCDYGDKTAPYPADPWESGGSPVLAYSNHVLSCLDCHEPHGSPNQYLLRGEVNGTQVPIITTSGKWWYFCTACHKNLKDYPNPGNVTKHFGGITSIGPDSTCNGCHYHGATYPTGSLTRCKQCTGAACTATPVKAF